jgi:hypothetical protein
MLAHVVWHTILALIAGIAIAALFWNLSSKRRKALRAIDLASYFLTIAAFGSGLYGVRHQEDRYQTAVERMLLTDQYVDTSWDDSMKLMSFCSPAAHSPFRITLQRQEECSRLGRMLNSHGLRDVTRLEVVPLPDTSEFTDADSRAIADVFRDHTPYATYFPVLKPSRPIRSLGKKHTPNESIWRCPKPTTSEICLLRSSASPPPR